MSRNICRTECPRCGDTPTITGPALDIKDSEHGVSFRELHGMKIAHADCSTCGALFWAWVTAPPYWTRGGDTDDRPFNDLSYRSTFNDEPGPDDEPPWSGQYLRGDAAHERAAEYEALLEARKLFPPAEQHRVRVSTVRTVGLSVENNRPVLTATVHYEIVDVGDQFSMTVVGRGTSWRDALDDSKHGRIARPASVASYRGGLDIEGSNTDPLLRRKVAKKGSP